MDDARPDIPAVLVGAEPVGGAGRLKPVRQILGEGVMRGDQRRQQRHQHQRHDDAEPDHRQPVAR